MTAFATNAELTAQYRRLTKPEEVRAKALLDLAAVLIRRRVDFTDVAPGDDLYRAAKQVSIDMVIEALVPTELRGRASYSVTVDAAVESATFDSKDGAGASTVVLTSGMLALLGVSDRQPAYYFGDDPQ